MTPTPTVASVVVSPAKDTLLDGASVQLTAVGLDASGAMVPNLSFTWSSDNATIASVSATGNVTALTAGGPVHIKATTGNFSGTSAIVDTAASVPVASVKVVPASTTIAVSGVAQLTDTVKDASGNVLVGRPITWTSGDVTKVTVSATGQVTGVAAGGPITITAATGGKMGTAQVTVTPASSTSNYIAIAAGGNHTCALAQSPQGAAFCWGLDTFGPLGNGAMTATPVTSPVAVSGGLTFTSITAGDQHTCGVATGGAAYCWGYNHNGQLGNNSTTASDVPVAVAGGLSFASISAGQAFTCGITTSGAAHCWGYQGIVGLLGNGTLNPDSVPDPVSGGGTYMAIGTGSTHACALTTAGAAFCWGSNTVGELGNGGVGANSEIPVAVSGGHVFTTISVGDDHSCGLVSGGAAYCWGAGTSGQLGNGSTSSSNVPVLVSGGLSFAAIAAGADYTCATLANGTGYCWGAAGALGTPTLAQYTVPTAMAGGLAFSMINGDVDAGYFGHACGITTSNLAYCWGSNRSGQLGNGTTSDSEPPTAVSSHP